MTLWSVYSPPSTRFLYYYRIIILLSIRKLVIPATTCVQGRRGKCCSSLQPPIGTSIYSVSVVIILTLLLRHYYHYIVSMLSMQLLTWQGRYGKYRFLCRPLIRTSTRRQCCDNFYTCTLTIIPVILYFVLIYHRSR